MARLGLSKDEPVPANALYVGDRLYLLAHGSGGTAHLAEEQAGGRAAFLEDDFEIALERGFEGDLIELREARWSPKALCGHAWVCMSPTNETRAFFWSDVEEVVAPGCKRCLKCLDRQFIEPDVAPAVLVLAELAAEQVLEVGSAEIRGVPGDQVEAMRKHAKRCVRALGFSCRSWAMDDLVVIYSDEAYEAIPSEAKVALHRDAADAMDATTSGEKRPTLTPWRLHWSTWDV